MFSSLVGRFSIVLIGCLLLAVSLANAAEFYVDPVHGSPSGDGSAGSPWRTIEEVIDADLIETRHWESLPYDQDGNSLAPKNSGAPIKAGDTIWLRSGYHGELSITGAYNTSSITIAALAGHAPQVNHILLRAVSNWTIRGLQVSPAFAPVHSSQTMIDIDNHGWQGPSSDLVISDCNLFSIADSSGWSASDWVNLSASGISVDGERVQIVNNTLTNVRFGITVTGDHALVEGNTISNFAGDGLRGLGDYGVFQYNLVENCYDVDGNHDDGFQSWSTGPGGVGTGEVVGVELRGNIIINSRDPSQPLLGTLQGIGCFDGYFVDWVVENNLVVVNHWHGITLSGARNSRIVNNTVIDIYDGRPGPSWIRLGSHKNGTSGTGNVVRNNLANSFSFTDTGVTADHNLEVDDAAAMFGDPANFKFGLKPGVEAIDSGSPDLAPTIDILKLPRPSGGGFDLGAYEFRIPNQPLNLRVTEVR